MSDGKSIVMEGLHLDPGLYLYEFGRHSPAHALREGTEPTMQPLPRISPHASEGSGRSAHAGEQEQQQQAGPGPGLRVEVDCGDEEQHPRCGEALSALPVHNMCATVTGLLWRDLNNCAAH